MRSITFLIFAFLAPGLLAGQNNGQEMTKEMIDSIKDAHIDGAALLYPKIRQFTISHQQTGSANIDSRLYGNEFFKGKIRMSRTAINMNVPVIDRRQDNLVGSIGVIHQFFDIDEIENHDVTRPVEKTSAYIPMINLGLAYTHRDTVFSHAVSFTGAVNALVNPGFSSRQFTFLALIAVPVFQRENSSLTIGAAGMVDPSSPAPAFLFVSYFHRFKGINLELLADLPYRVALRKPIGAKASISAFSEMAGSNSFFEFENPSPTLPAKMTYATLEVKSGLLFEYRVTKKLILSASGGLNATVKSRILEQGAAPNDYFIKNKNGSAPYAQVGLSMLPFWRPFRK